MKRLLKISITISLILFLSGCVPSLHPLYEGEDRMRIKELEGIWYSDEKEEIYRIVRDENDSLQYNVAYTEME
jgi:hypothetical protein